MIKRMDALQTQTVKSTTAPQPNYIPGLIAVVGCDGTGKSTLTNDLVKSLQQHWQTERRYLGLLSGEDGDKIKRLPLVGVWLERRLAAKSSKTQSMKTKSPALWAAVIMYCFSLRRMANLRKVQRLAQSGVLVVSDRFPQAEISGFYYDGPGIGVERATGKISRFLAQRERRLYQKMAQYRPELIIRLGIDIDTAISASLTMTMPSCRTKSASCRRLVITAQKFLRLIPERLTARCWNRHKRRFLWLPSFLTAEV